MELSDYEKLREKNIKERQEMLKTILAEFSDIMKTAPLTPKKKTTPDLSRKRKSKSTYRLSTVRSFSPPRTRSRAGSISSAISSPDSPNLHNPQRLIVCFPFNKRRRLFNDNKEIEIFDEDEPKEKIIIRRRSYLAKDHKIIPPEEITEEQLDNVADSVGEKYYDKIDGSSCHQCRQKTADQKTVCRSSECIGVRGQFCGVCLRNRYGEDAREALKDPDWICPPCRGICNCSFCRPKMGRTCTGILIHEARQKGYNSVKDYLEDVEDFIVE